MTGLLPQLEAVEQRIAALTARLTQTVERVTARLSAVGVGATRAVLVDLPTLAAGTTGIIVTWSTPFDDSTYVVSPVVVGPAAAAGKIFATVQAGSLAQDVCVVVVANTTAQVQAVKLAVLAVDVLPRFTGTQTVGLR